MRNLLLKAAATVLTLASALGSALYVTTHLKNPAAPLQPAVLTAAGAPTTVAVGGPLIVGPGVQPTDASPVASTYAS